MNVSATMRGWFGIPRAGPAFRPGGAGGRSTQECEWDDRVESIRSILRQGGHNVTQLSAATGRRYGTRSPYFIPAAFLYKLRSGITPHVCQILALSESTGYCFVDWLRIFGFDLHQIPRLQMQLHTEQTVLITPSDGCPGWLQPGPSSPYETVRRSSLFSNLRSGPASRRYLFAKIGTRDQLLRPRLLPGSVVRVDRRYTRRIPGVDDGSREGSVFLVEQSSGLTCCQVRWIDDRQIVLLPNRPPWGRWPLRVPTEARILGLVDLDPPPTKSAQFQPRAVPTPWEPIFSPHRAEPRMKFSELLRISRRRTGLTLRAAHRLTRTTAHVLGSREYGIALGLLSDYEAMDKLPRHIAKIFSLCIIYCIDFHELLAAAGVQVDDSARLPLLLPDNSFQIHSDFLDPAGSREPGGRVASYAQSAGGQA